MDDDRTLLVLWDIDRTLIDAAGVDKQVWLDVCADLTGKPVSRPESTSGRTDPDILLDILMSAPGIDLERARALLPEALRREAELLAARADDLARCGRALPGAHAALQALNALPGITQTVVTGNVRGNAETKLNAFDLIGYLDLDLGGFGSDSADRAALIRLARHRASTARHTAFTPATTVVLGDSLRDIHAARIAGARTIAIATGRTPADELRKASPDALHTDLRDTAAIVREILGSTRRTPSKGPADGKHDQSLPKSVR